MPNPSFDFKQFSIRQDRCAMKVGTDGVLLGAWAGEGLSIQKALDIGTGTGLVALMLAQRFCCDTLHIDAVEIDTEAAMQAHENVEDSPWGHLVTVIPASLANASTLLKDARYDIIVSNPPFYNATLKPEDEARAAARHKDSLPVDEIARFADLHLSEDGRLSLIYPTDYDSEVMAAVVIHGLHPVRICDVLTKEGKTCKRRMAEFSKTPSSIIRTLLPIRALDGHYTPLYRSLTEAFYLHLSE